MYQVNFALFQLSSHSFYCYDIMLNAVREKTMMAHSQSKKTVKMPTRKSMPMAGSTFFLLNLA